MSCDQFNNTEKPMSFLELDSIIDFQNEDEIKDFEERMQNVERITTDNKTEFTLNSKNANVILESNSGEIEKVKRICNVLTTQLKDLEKQNDNDKVDCLLKKMENQEKDFEKFLKKYEAMRDELRSRFGSLGAI